VTPVLAGHRHVIQFAREEREREREREREAFYFILKSIKNI